MLRTFLRILKLGSVYKWWMILAAFIGFLTVGSGIGLLMTSAYLIAKAALMPSISELQVAIVGVRFFGISRGVFRYFERLVSHETTFKLLSKFRVWFFKSIEPIAPAKTNRFASSDLLTRAVSDIQSLEHIFVRVISPPIIAAFILLLMWFLLGIFSFTYSIVFTICYLTAAIVVPVLTYNLSLTIGETIITLRSKLNELALDTVQGLAELSAFGQAENHKKKFQTVEKQLLSSQRKMVLISGLNDSLIGLLMNIAVVSLMITAIPNISNGILDGVYLSVLTIGIMASFEAVLPLPLSIQFLGNSVKAADRLFEITDIMPDVSENGLTPKNISSYDISISNLSFGYNSKDYIFNDLKLIIKQNNITSIVGASGSGKTSLTNLLVKFWDYEKGEITLGETSYKQIPQEQIRNLISVIPQQVRLFNGTVKDNLLIAKENASENELNLAIEKAGLTQLINSLPDKLNSWIGEQGKQLSGGERKRLAIARAILKDSPILICDEITADLDSVNEKKIVDSIFEIRENKTVLFITHRLVEMERFNDIYVMRHGKIIESGKHKQLVEKNGYYKQMLVHQFETLI